jgi:hypothetical protein
MKRNAETRNAVWAGARGREISERDVRYKGPEILVRRMGWDRMGMGMGMGMGMCQGEGTRRCDGGGA